MDHINKSELEQLHRKLADRINHKTSFPQHNGICILRVGLHHCIGTLDLSPETQNSLGIVHGGALFSLADTVAGVAVCSGGVSAVTLNSSFDFLRVAKVSPVRCVAEPVKLGNKVCVFRTVLTDGEGTVVATGQFTFVIRGPIQGYDAQGWMMQ